MSQPSLKDGEQSSSEDGWMSTLRPVPPTRAGLTGHPHRSVALYSLVLGAFLLPAGRLAEVYSPRTLFLLGTTFYCLVSVAIALAPSWQIFAGASALLGLGAAAVSLLLPQVEISSLTVPRILPPVWASLDRTLKQERRRIVPLLALVRDNRLDSSLD